MSDLFIIYFNNPPLPRQANSLDKSRFLSRQIPSYELPSALADGQCLKDKKALAESVNLNNSLQL
jgi:hypothetical protein